MASKAPRLFCKVAVALENCLALNEMDKNWLRQFYVAYASSLREHREREIQAWKHSIAQPLTTHFHRFQVLKQAVVDNASWKRTPLTFRGQTSLKVIAIKPTVATLWTPRDRSLGRS